MASRKPKLKRQLIVAYKPGDKVIFWDWDTLKYYESIVRRVETYRRIYIEYGGEIKLVSAAHLRQKKRPNTSL